MGRPVYTGQMKDKICIPAVPLFFFCYCISCPKVYFINLKLRMGVIFSVADGLQPGSKIAADKTVSAGY